MDDRWNDELHT